METSISSPSLILSTLEPSSESGSADLYPLAVSYPPTFITTSTVSNDSSSAAAVAASSSSSFHISNATIISETIQEGSYVPYAHRPETYLAPLIFLVIFVVGFIGNGLLIFIFTRHKSLRNVPNTFILCLSAGDFLVIVGTVPFISLIYTVESWPFGGFICKLSEFIRDLSIGVTSLSLMVLSIDRYLAIAMALKQLNMSCRSKKMAYAVSAVVWTLSIAIAAPGAYTSHVMEYQTSNETYIHICYPFPEESLNWYPKIIIMTKFILLYVIPLFFISISYAMLARHLLLTKARAKKTGVPTPSNYQNQLKSRAKVAKLVLVFVVIFVVSFLPNHIFMFWFYYTYPNSLQNYNRYWHYFKIAGYVLTFANSCTNPFVLYMSSGRFRSYYRQYLCFLRPQKHQNQHALVLRYANLSRSGDAPFTNNSSGTNRSTFILTNAVADTAV